MMPKEIIEFVVRKEAIKNRELLEKDLLLTKLLYYLASEKNFLDNYAFKGGTCLIKCYLSYYRFSEDLDFTYIDQKDFKDKSQTKTRGIISAKIDQLAEMLEKISKTLGLRFKAEKNNPEYFQYGGGNTFVTFKLWYKSEVMDKNTFIKLQINYREELDYAIKEVKAKSVISEDIEKEFSLLFSEDSKILAAPIAIKAYDLREILVEKIRAIPTRRGVKARDFVDVYKIIKLEDIKIETLSNRIINKTQAMLRFEKYNLNLEKKQASGFIFDIHEEEKMLLAPLDKDFDEFLLKFRIFLQDLASKIKPEEKDKHK